MIKRYSRERMSAVWSVNNKFSKWLDVEKAVCYAHYKKGNIPLRDYQIIIKKADFDIKRINEIEKTVKHDVIAFLTSVGEFIGHSSRFVHMGLTSSDMLDTANALIMKESTDEIIKGLYQLKNTLYKKAVKYKDTPIMGRTHGVHAEPTTVGLKMLIWYDDLQRVIEYMKFMKEKISVGKISGPVGNYANIDTSIEKTALKKLGLKSAKISNQIISRDIYCDYIYAIVKTAVLMEKITLQIRLLQRTETREFEEPFTKGQKGSSAMPHKRNPVLCEQICGLSRVLKGHLIASLDNNALWDERDISHSSVERIILPDSSILIDYIIDKMNFVIKDMKVYTENADKNIYASNGLFFSQRVMLFLIEKGLTRENAYKIVQEAAMHSWSENIDFKKCVLKNKEIMKHISKKEIDMLFDLKQFLKQTDKIFKRFKND